jgi:hypothetical protein
LLKYRVKILLGMDRSNVAAVWANSLEGCFPRPRRHVSRNSTIKRTVQKSPVFPSFFPAPLVAFG